MLIFCIITHTHTHTSGCRHGEQDVWARDMTPGGYPELLDLVQRVEHSLSIVSTLRQDCSWVDAAVQISIVANLPPDPPEELLG